MKKLFFCLFAVLLSLSSFADVVEIDGIVYDLNSETKEATVLAGYSGDVIIPSSVTSSNVTYDVTSIGDYAFRGYTGLTSIEIPNSVTSIGNRAFFDCTGLTRVNITDIAAWCNLEFLDIYSNPINYAHNLYLNGEKVTNLVIPEGVTSIGAGTFIGCSSLTSVDIPNSVTSIGAWAFRDCTGLNSIEIPDNVTRIVRAAFDNTTWYNNLPDGLIYAGKVFYKYKGTMPNNTSIVLKEGTTGIAGEAFLNCTGLTSIEIPNSVTNIGLGAFQGCQNLKSIAIPNSVTIIDRFAFSYCSDLTSIEIPNSVTSIGMSAFKGCSGLTSITCEATTPPVCEYYGSPFDDLHKSACPLYVPAGSVEAYKAEDKWKDFENILPIEEPEDPAIVFADENVKAICVAKWDTNGDGELSKSEAAAVTELNFYFGGHENIVSFDELQYFTGLTSIGDFAFGGCSSLTSVIIPNSVTTIGEAAFYECTGLTSIEMPNSVISVGEGAFQDCKGLTSIDIPNSVTSIDEQAFYGCIGLTSVKIPNSVTSIGERAFSGCTGLTSIIVSNENPTYDSRDNCNAIIETASNMLISGCRNTVVPNSVTGIGNSAFNGCSGLTSIEIPNSVTSIGNYAFAGCKGLTSIEIPNSITTISDGTFSVCDYLTSIEIPSSVTSIGARAFQVCIGLKYIEIPSSVTSIGAEAFYCCSGLTSIKCKATIPPTCENYAFEKVGKSACTLYVPTGSLEAYKTADPWKDFVNIIGFEEESDDCYITIRMGDGGELQQSVELGKIYTYKVKADDGWTVNTLTFNGQDMTGQLLDGQFSTPIITGDAELNVVFKQEASNIKSMKQTETSKVKVYAYNGTIKVTGAEDDAEVEVYNTGSIRIADGEGNCSILLDSGIYIVKVGNETFKVSL